MENAQNKEVNDTTDYKSIVKDNIKTEYGWKIIELKTTTLKAASENDELIENETEEILKNITKDGLLKEADEYGLDEEEISYIKGMTADDFENFKNETLRPYAADEAKKNIKEAIKEVADEYKFTILDIKSKDEIKDIDIYLDAYSIGDDMKEDVKKKMNNGTYVAVVEMDVATKFNVVEVCDGKGKIIK
ncbi:MAG: hypothetical protein CVT88_04845 [Candidatus Altiarchaeales archaeon HGW-Altiarchaeales-1]|nr:MAG: hypothetical protein CVT88_04845 [Candidatus Altiarchaeales archaeon HGW-Altiarchaeales-1]